MATNDEIESFCSGFEIRPNARLELEARERMDILCRFPRENPDPVLCVHIDGRLILANPASAPLLSAWGISEGEIIADWLHRQVQHASSLGQAQQIEFECASKFYEFSLVPQRDSSLVNLYGHDVTRQRNIESDLRERERKLQAIVNTAPDCIKLVDAQGRIIELNDAGLEFLEADRVEEVIGRNQTDFIVPEDHDHMNQALATIFQGQTAERRFRVQGLRGRLRWLETRMVPVEDDAGDVTACLAITRDITSQKAAEEQLRQERDFKERLLDTAPIIIVLLDLEGRIQHVNRYFEKLSGYNPNALKGQDWFSSFLPHGECEAVRERFKDALSGVRTKGLRNQIVVRDGSHRDVEWFDELMRDDHGTVTGLLAIGQDVTSRSRAERELRSQEERFRKMIENSDEIIALFDQSGTTLYVSSAVQTILNVSPAEIAGQNAAELCHPDDRELLHSMFSLLSLKPDSVSRGEFRWRHQDGAYRWLEVVAKNELHDPAVAAIVANLRDITSRRQTEADLRAKDSAIATSINAIAFASPDGGLSYVNQSFLRMWGYERKEEVLGRSPLEFWQSPQRAADVVQALLTNGEWVGELTAQRRDGSLFEVQLSGTLLRDALGRPASMMGSFVDVTDRKRYEENLRQNEAKYRTLIERAKDMIFRMSVPDGRFEYVSPSARHVLGYSAEELLADPQLLRRAMQSTSQFEAAPSWTENLLAGVQPYCEYCIVDPAGRERWITQSNVAITDDQGTVIAIQGICRDETHRKEAEAALRVNKARLAEAERIARIGNWQLDLRTNELTWSNMVYDIFEIDRHSSPASYEAFLANVHPEDRSKVHESYQTSLRTRRPYEIVHRLQMADGRIKFVQERCETIYDAQGNPIRSHGTVQDVTERVRTEQTLRKSELKYRHLFEQMPDGVLVIDLTTGMPLEFNDVIAHTLGYSTEEFATLSTSHHVSPFEQERLAEIVAELARGNQSGSFEGRIITKQGDIRDVFATVAIVEHEGTRVLQCICRDITEQKREAEQAALLRDELAHLSRMVTLGELAAGLAHELNQPLGAISLYSHVAEQIELGQHAAKAKECLQHIREQSLRAGEIIRRLRSLAKNRPTNREVCDVNELVREVLRLEEYELRLQMISVMTDLASEIPPLELDAIQIQQVVLNLIRNAIDALTGSEPQDQRIWVKTFAAEGFVCIEVSDTGKGIPEAMAEHLFEPFQTTKPDGLGMGLAICRNIIEAHGGQIIAAPSLPRGAKFTVKLPRNARGT